MRRRGRIFKKPLPKHVAIILDGNGRWAKRRGKPRTYGHRHGALNLRRIAFEAHDLGIEVLSVFAFSTENWKRPKAEIDFLMQLPHDLREEFKDRFKHDHIRVVFSGRRDRAGEKNRELMEELEEKTKDRDGLIVNVCLDYGGRYELTEAAKSLAAKVREGVLKPQDIDEETFAKELYTHPLPPVDLLIRTSGELRISNFLLWQAAYAEFYFTKVHWPAFSVRRFHKAILSYQGRERKFGGLKGSDKT